MYHYIYKMTNKLNGCYYIGCRSCKTRPEKDKKYYGSGLWIKNSKKKYGLEEFKKIFKKEIWFLCKDRDTKFRCEAWIITKELMRDTLNMNFKLGGASGRYWLNKQRSKETKEKIGEKNKGQIPWNKGLKTGPLSEKHKRKIGNAISGENHWNYGKILTVEERKELSLRFKDKKKSPRTEEHINNWKIARKRNKDNGKCAISGEQHHSYGTIWITNGILSQQIKKESEIPLGWQKGMTRKKYKKGEKCAQN